MKMKNNIYFLEAVAVTVFFARDVVVVRGAAVAVRAIAAVYLFAGITAV
jgi:hypothetical protein